MSAFILPINIDGFRLARGEYFFSGPEPQLEHHRGDMLFLRALGDRLNQVFGLKESETAVRVPLVLKKNASGYRTCVAFDFSKRINLSVELELIDRLDAQAALIERAGYSETRILLLNGEIDSSPLRTIGLRRRIDCLALKAHQLGFECVYLGRKPEKVSSDIPMLEIVKGFSNGEAFLHRYSRVILGVLTFDNYWMHYCVSVGIDAFVVQRHKVLPANLINHVSLINHSCLVRARIRYC